MLLRRLRRSPSAPGPVHPAPSNIQGADADGTEATRWSTVPDAAAAGRPAALLIDDRWPQPDRDAGSIEVMNLVEALLALGFDVAYAADQEFAGVSPDRTALARRGVRCIGPADAPSVEAFLEQEGRRFSLCVLNRVYGGGRFFEAVRRHCPSARVLFNTIDLCWVRLEREARLRGDDATLEVAASTRAREALLALEADAAIVVSPADRALLAEQTPGAYIVELPLAREVRAPRVSFEARDGIGFVGGFKHAPNLDAVRFFLGEVWPLVLEELPKCRFSVAGPDLPPGALDGAPGTVAYLGHVPDLDPWFEGLRLTVAPLRYGAGLKGKVVSSLAAGVPCVGTSVAMEGMAVRDGGAALVADTPQGLAQRIVAAHSDPALWSRLSAAGLAYVAENLSLAGWRRRLEDALWVLGVLPENASP